MDTDDDNVIDFLDVTKRDHRRRINAAADGEASLSREDVSADGDRRCTLRAPAYDAD